MQYFPSGIATGAAFCNRVAERKQLQLYIDAGKHTVIMAPRRYGKSSLITQVMLDHKYVYAWVDFLSIASVQDVEEKIRSAAKELLFSLSPKLKELGMQAVDKIKSMNAEIELSAVGQKLTLDLSSDKDLPLEKVLLALEQYAAKVGRRAVLVFDEFQQLSILKESHALEAKIRNAVERSSHIVYLFSGSNRHLLHEMFSQSKRPLYRLCSVMHINRIAAACYVNFINKAAVDKWGRELNAEVVERILHLTERHPYYVNALCGELWLSAAAPVIADVDQTWNQYVVNGRSMIVADVLNLAVNQKRVIKALAHAPENSPTGHAFASLVGINPTSVRRALEYLHSKDLVYKSADGYWHVLDPAVAYYYINS